jgi:hypothetical protein
LFALASVGFLARVLRAALMAATGSASTASATLPAERALV